MSKIDSLELPKSIAIDLFLMMSPFEALEALFAANLKIIASSDLPTPEKNQSIINLMIFQEVLQELKEAQLKVLQK